MIGRLLRAPFFRDAALTGTTSVLNAVAALIGGVLVARALGPEGRGTLSVLAALGSITVLLGTLGLHTSTVYFLGQEKASRETIVANSRAAACLGGLIAGALLCVATLLAPDLLLQGIPLGLFLLFLPWVPLNYFNEFGSRIALGLGRVPLYNLHQLATAAGLLFGTALMLALFGDELEPLIAMRVLTEAVVFVALFVVIRRRFPLRLPTAPDLLRSQVRYGLRNYASSLLWILLLQLDLVLCNYFLGAAEAGIYSVAVSLGMPMTILGAFLGTLVFQRTSRQDDGKTRRENTNLLLRLLSPLLLVIAVALGVSSSTLVPLIYGDEFAPAAAALVLLLPGLLVLTLEMVLINHLAGTGSPPVVYRAPLVGLVVNVAGNLVAIPALGIEGAAITSTVGYALVFALVFAHYLKVTGSRARDALVPRRADLDALRRRSG